MRSAETRWVVALVTVVIAGTLLARHGAPRDAGDLLGHGLGVVGLALMVFAWLGYSWRKHPRRTGPGALRHWLAAHVVTGILGPWMALLHGGFRIAGVAGLLTLTMLVVVASGVYGRFVYARSGRGGADPVPARGGIWWLLHVPLAAVLFVLAVLHVGAVLWYTSSLV